jgi:hypothetical protein
MTKIEGSGSGSISQRHGSRDPEHWLKRYRYTAEVSSKYITFFCIDGLLHPHLLVDLHPVARQAGNGSRCNNYKNISHGKARLQEEKDTKFQILISLGQIKESGTRY